MTVSPMSPNAKPVQRRKVPAWAAFLRPWVWIAPSVVLVTVFLLYPVFSTVRLSFFDQYSVGFVGFANFRRIFTKRREKPPACSRGEDSAVALRRPP